MKKLIGLVVAVSVVVAFSVYAAETTKVVEKDTVKTAAGTEKIKEETKTTAMGTETKVTDKTKTEKATLDVKKEGTTVEGSATLKEKGKAEKFTVTFKKFEENSDYIYVIDKGVEYKVKHTLSETDKANLMKKKDQQIEITSTYPLTMKELATITAAK